MTNKPRIKHGNIWAIAWPMILANVATTLIGLVDTAILGHLSDPAFIGGAAVATSLFNIIYMSLAFLRMGTTGLIAQHYGEQGWQNLFATLCLSVALATAIGLALVACSQWIFALSIPLIGGSADVQDLALEYARIRVLSSPSVLFNFVAVGFLIGTQRSQQALLLLMFSQSINIGLDFYLAVYLEWQMAGIAWATVISDYFGSGLAFYFMFIFLGPRVQNKRELPDIKSKLLRIFNLNRNIFFRTIILIGTLAFVTAQSARQGDVILATNSILMQLFLFLGNAVDGFANAAESKTGEAIGYSRKHRGFSPNNSISTSYSLSLQQAGLFISVVFIALFFLSDVLLSLITNQVAVLESTQKYFFWLFILLYCCIVCFVIDGVFIGAAKARSMLIAISVSTLVVFFPCWYFTQGLGNNGLWLSLCAFMLFRSALSHLLYRQLQNRNVWLEP